MAKTIYRAEYRQLIDMLRGRRETLGISQGELAKRLGWTQQKISFIETGARRMDVLEYVNVARALGLSPTTAFSRAERLTRS
jgi:transcriptional regulator with XRE-family HTH domain